MSSGEHLPGLGGGRGGRRVPKGSGTCGASPRLRGGPGRSEPVLQREGLTQAKAHGPECGYSFFLGGGGHGEEISASPHPQGARQRNLSRTYPESSDNQQTLAPHRTDQQGTSSLDSQCAKNGGKAGILNVGSGNLWAPETFQGVREVKTISFILLRTQLPFPVSLSHARSFLSICTKTH